ncbi:hypothetical protein ACFX15_008121 [Malus domestica]
MFSECLSENTRSSLLTWKKKRINKSIKVEEKGRFIAGLLVQQYFYTGYLGQFLHRGLEHQTSDPYTFATENTSSLELRSSIPLTIIRALATSPPFEENHARTFSFTPNMHQWNPVNIFSGPWRLCQQSSAPVRTYCKNGYTRLT